MQQKGVVDKSVYDNRWYNPGPFWKRLAWIYVSALFFQNGFFPFNGFKARILRAFGAKVGKGLTIKPFVTIKYPWLLEIGDYVGIGEQVWIDNLAKVTLENQVTISQGALLLTGNHNFSSPTFDLFIGEIHVEAGAWVGARTVICQNVRVGTHAILTVGSVATKNLAPYQICSGNPAEPKKERVIRTEKEPT